MTETTPSTSGKAPTSADPSTPPRPGAMPSAVENKPVRKQRGPVSRFFRSLFSHFLFAGAAVAGVLGYLYHVPILRDVGDTVCADKVLGQWMSEPPGSSTAMATGDKSASPMRVTAADRAAQTQGVSAKPHETLDGAKTSASPVSEPPHAVAAAPVPPQSQPGSVEHVASETQVSKNTAPAASAKGSSGAGEAPAAAASSPSASTNSPAEVVEATPAAAATETKTATQHTKTSAPPATEAAVAHEPAATSTSSTDSPVAAPRETAALTTDGAGVEPTPAPPSSSVPAASPVAPSQDAPQSAETEQAAMMKQWAAARQAYADGKPEAVESYKDLAARFNHVPELTGELGNIYFQQGKMGEAAEQYFETAQRLIRNDKPGQAACLVDVLKYLDAGKAKELQQLTAVPCPVQRRN